MDVLVYSSGVCEILHHHLAHLQSDIAESNLQDLEVMELEDDLVSTIQRSLVTWTPTSSS